MRNLLFAVLFTGCAREEAMLVQVGSSGAFYCPDDQFNAVKTALEDVCQQIPNPPAGPSASPPR
jgi:hypothetical protein